MIRLKRVYLPQSPDDGARILVDRLWPRGLTRQRAAVDLWLKDIAPTTDLRKWFAHDPHKWPEFQKRYRAELRKNPAPLNTLRQKSRAGPITLLFGAKDEQHNEAVVLKALLQRKRKPKPAS
jgi:uncharacterized protein YeaO (DUF488 family)